MEQSKQEKESFLEKVKESGDTAKIATKLSRGPVEVAINEKQSELDLLELDELTIKTNTANLDTDSENGQKLISESEKALQVIAERRVELEKHTTKAYIVPLQYRDSRIVQTAITEALLSVQGMGFDTDTRIVMVLQEKKMMTIYLALRTFSNTSLRYFKALEDIAKASDRTIDKIYEEYVKEFELTEEERKNL